MSDEDPDLLTDDELREAIAEAEAIEAKPKPTYQYTDPNYRGGPRNTPPEILQAAAIEIGAARQVVAELEEALNEARFLMYEKLQEWAEAGVPKDALAAMSGVQHRSNVIRILRDTLPKMRRDRETQDALRRSARSEQ